MPERTFELRPASASSTTPRTPASGRIGSSRARRLVRRALAAGARRLHRRRRLRALARRRPACCGCSGPSCCSPPSPTSSPRSPPPGRRGARSPSCGTSATSPPLPRSGLPILPCLPIARRTERARLITLARPRGAFAATVASLVQWQQGHVKGAVAAGAACSPASRPSVAARHADRRWAARSRRWLAVARRAGRARRRLVGAAPLPRASLRET